MNILVTGGTGQIGKELSIILPNADYISSSQYNLINEDSVISLLTSKQYDAVIHLAAKVGGIIDNINKPSEYFTDNILMNTHLVNWSRLTGVKRFIGILSTCIFPDVVDEYPMKEGDMHLGAPTPTNFSYAYAKRCMAVHIDACNRQYNTRYNYLTPCNLYSTYDKTGSNSHFMSALISKIISTELLDDNVLRLFGTGRPLRQFMHARDVAYIIKEILDKEIYENMNIATDEMYSINDMANLALHVTDHCDWEIEYDNSKPDGQYRKDVSISKFRQYFPDYKFINLEQGIKEVYDAFKIKYKTYE